MATARLNHLVKEGRRHRGRAERCSRSLEPLSLEACPRIPPAETFATIGLESTVACRYSWCTHLRIRSRKHTMSGVVLLAASDLAALTTVLSLRARKRASERDDRRDAVSQRWIADHQAQDRS
jgi:hypothetical protein